VRGGRPARSSRPWGRAQRMLGVQQWIADVVASPSAAVCVADLRRCLPTTSVTGVQQSTRYCGALPCRHLCMRYPSEQASSRTEQLIVITSLISLGAEVALSNYDRFYYNTHSGVARNVNWGGAPHPCPLSLLFFPSPF